MRCLYKVNGMLGRGGFGEVVALDSRRVAKIQQSLKSHDPGVSCAVVREIMAMSVVDNGQRLGRVLLEKDGTCAMEIKRYHITLLDWIRNTPTHERAAAAASILSDLVHELHACASQSIVHRDLKPENVMLDKRGNAHIIDWGMSRFVVGDVGSWTPGMTTVWYRAPELFTGDEYGAAVDVWSLGVMLVELITGTCPFRGRTEVAQIREYIEVLGLPTVGALPRWPFPEVAHQPEPSRISLWEVVPAIRESGLAELIDCMISWDMSHRITLDTLVNHPLLSRDPLPTARGPLQPARDPLRPARDPLRLLPKLIHNTILPLCVRFRLGSAVLWASAKIAEQVVKKEYRSPKLITTIACVDLANKIVGKQDLVLLRKLRIRAGCKTQVHIVNTILGIDGLRSIALLSPPVVLAKQLAALEPSRLLAKIKAHAHAYLDACLLRRNDTSSTNEMIEALVHAAKFVVTGHIQHLRKCRDRVRARPRPRPRPGITLTLAALLARPLRSIHPSVVDELRRDPVMQRRAIVALHCLRAQT
jgi:serine/threonine protein kinase